VFPIAYPHGSCHSELPGMAGFQQPGVLPVLPVSGAGLLPTTVDNSLQLPAPQWQPVQPQAIPNAIPIESGVERIDPQTVHRLLQNRQCVLIDLRTYDLDSGRIPGTTNVSSHEFPMIVPELAQRLSQENLVVFTCQYSAHRSPQCANWYKESAPPGQRIGIMTGGFRGWEAAGLPVSGAAQNIGVNQAADAFAIRQGFELNAMRSLPNYPAAAMIPRW